MTRLNIKDFDINTLQLLMHCVMKYSRVVDVRDLVNRTEQSSAEEGTLVRSVRHRRMLNFSLCSCALCGRCL